MPDSEENKERNSTHVFSNEEVKEIEKASKTSDTKTFSSDEMKQIQEASKKEK